MAGVILILGLIGAGIYTENSIFYWVAGVIGGLFVLYAFFVSFLVRFVFKKMNNDLDRFDENISPFEFGQQNRIRDRKFKSGRYGRF